MEIIGLDEVKIKKISKMKNESRDILDYRLKCYEIFKKIDLPHFGPKINIDFDKIKYYLAHPKERYDLANKIYNYTSTRFSYENLVKFILSNI